MVSTHTVRCGVTKLCLLIVLGIFTVAAHALPEDCIPDGGQATCTAPISVPGAWQYMLCDDFGPYIGRSALWCTVKGGTWHGPYAPEPCVGAAVLSEPVLYPFSESFERQVHNVQGCPFTGQDNGWLAPGGVINSSNCWSGGPVYQNGFEVSNLREMPFSGQSYNSYQQSCGPATWNERVLALRTRKLETGCPAGYTLRVSRFTGQLECYALQPVDCQISLSGFPAAVEPGKKREGLQAQVTCTGKSAKDIPVTITSDVTQFTGGHQHDQGRRPQHAGAVGFPNGNVTGPDGVVPFSLYRPSPSGRSHDYRQVC